MNKHILTITLCVAVVSLSGCALTTEQIDLQYKQQQGVSQISGANHISVNVQVDDSRQIKTKVSSKKNGLGIEMAPIIAKEDVTLTIRNAIEEELRVRGFQLLGLDDALLRVVVDVTRFYNDFKMGFFTWDAIADLNMFVIVKSKKGKLLYSRNVVAQGIEPNIMLAGGNNARLALDRALENNMKSLFENQEFWSALMTISK